MKTKTECGLVYYWEDSKWKMAGRENHPLTARFLKLLDGEDVCVCEDCKNLEKIKSGRIK